MDPSKLAERVLIKSRTEAGRILSSPSRRSEIASLLSIGTPTEPPPAGFRFVAHKLRLMFADEFTAERGGPTLMDIERLVAFSRTIQLYVGYLLVHCQAGISRSSAAAMVALRVLCGPGSEFDLAQHLRLTRPECRPNPLMLRLADQVLAAHLWSAWSQSSGTGRQ